MAKKGARPFIRLKCGDCGKHNYTTKKNRINTQEALKLKKFCNKCRKQTPHKETKI
ncbi:MAG: 50S ribosomal protein L33 [Patescibacteria group bacterium]|nr:MAG: 50S ribosomal protein L33 [Patescibacteria group bacterium]